MEEASEAVVEVEGEEGDGEEIEGGDGAILEAVDDHLVDIVAAFGVVERGERGVDFLGGEMEEMEDDEAEDGEAAEGHEASGAGGGAVFGDGVGGGASGAIFGAELDGEVDMGEEHDEEGDADDPEEFAEILEELGVLVEGFWAEEDLEVADEMTDDEAEEGEAGEGDDGFAADGRGEERGEGIHEKMKARIGKWRKGERLVKRESRRSEILWGSLAKLCGEKRRGFFQENERLGKRERKVDFLGITMERWRWLRRFGRESQRFFKKGLRMVVGRCFVGVHS